MRVKTKGPIFDPQLKVNLALSYTKAMKKTVLLAETNIKKGYKPSPAPNVIGGRKTSHLSRGIRGKVFNPFKAIIAPGRFAYGSDVPYAGIVENGRSASAQKIRPRKSKALKFKTRTSTKFLYRKSTQPFKRSLKGNPMFKKTADMLTGSASPLLKVWSNEVMRVLR